MRNSQPSCLLEGCCCCRELVAPCCAACGLQRCPGPPSRFRAREQLEEQHTAAWGLSTRRRSLLPRPRANATAPCPPAMIGHPSPHATLTAGIAGRAASEQCMPALRCTLAAQDAYPGCAGPTRRPHKRSARSEQRSFAFALQRARCAVTAGNFHAPDTRSRRVPGGPQPQATTPRAAAASYDGCAALEDFCDGQPGGRLWPGLRRWAGALDAVQASLRRCERALGAADAMRCARIAGLSSMRCMAFPAACLAPMITPRPERTPSQTRAPAHPGSAKCRTRCLPRAELTMAATRLRGCGNGRPCTQPSPSTGGHDVRSRVVDDGRPLTLAACSPARFAYRPGPTPDALCKNRPVDADDESTVPLVFACRGHAACCTLISAVRPKRRLGPFGPSKGSKTPPMPLAREPPVAAVSSAAPSSRPAHAPSPPVSAAGGSCPRPWPPAPRHVPCLRSVACAKDSAYR